MRIPAAWLVSWVCSAALILLGAALVLAFIRLLRGPSLPDRVIALDLMAVLVMGVTAVHTLRSGQTVYLDAAIVLGLISFLGTVAFARYIAMRGNR